MNTDLVVHRLGVVEYSKGLELMENARLRVAEKCAPGGGELLVLQHPPVVTLGHRPLLEDLKIGPLELKTLGISYFKTDRGGSATVHELGQIVVYPVVKLDPKRLGPKRFVNLLEEAMILAAAQFGVEAARDAVNPGIWVERNKLGAIGIRIVHGVVTHGLAFNVCNDLSTFAHVVPCGLVDRGVTTLARETGREGVLGASRQAFFDAVETRLVTELNRLLANEAVG
jgi:lipoate-protein ligase B